MKPVKLIMCSVIFLAPYLADAQKAWEMEEAVISNRLPYQIVLQKDHNSGAPRTSFTVNVRNRTSNANLYFVGECKELLETQALVTTMPERELDRFVGSQSGRDLPFQEELRLMRETLVDQCPALQVLRVSLSTPIYRENTVHDYKGTLLRSDGWRLQDGTAQTEFDLTVVVELRTHDPITSIGIDHKGTCEIAPTLELMPRYVNAFDETFRGGRPLPLRNYTRFAEIVTKAYLEECPQTTEIHFNLNPQPDDFVCGNSDECFLVTAAQNDWALDWSTYDTATAVDAAVQDYDDFLRLLYAGDFSEIDNYSSFFGVFYNDFLDTYSEFCAAYIEDPVQREFIPTTIDVDFNGNPIDPPRQIGPAQMKSYERKYVDKKDEYAIRNTAWSFNHLMQLILESALSGRTADVASMIADLTLGNYSQLETFIDGGSCTSGAVKLVYDNMYRYAHGQPAITETETMSSAQATVTPITPPNRAGSDVVAEQRGGAVATLPEVSNPPPEQISAAEQSRARREEAEERAARRMQMANEMQSVSEQHLQAQQAEFDRIMSQMLATESNEERAALQIELQQGQQESTEALREKLAAIQERYQ